MGIQLNYFESYFSSIDLGPTSAISMVSGNNNLIVRWPRVESAIGKTMSPAQNNRSGLPIGQTILANYEGPDKLFRRVAITALEVNGNPLYLTVSKSRTALLQP